MQGRKINPLLTLLLCPRGQNIPEICACGRVKPGHDGNASAAQDRCPHIPLPTCVNGWGAWYDTSRCNLLTYLRRPVVMARLGPWDQDKRLWEKGLPRGSSWPCVSRPPAHRRLYSLRGGPTGPGAGGQNAPSHDDFEP